MKTRLIAIPVLAVVALTACATVPTGPSVMALPGSGKNFHQFQTDDAVCRQWAERQTGTTPDQNAAANTVGGAVVGTVVGAALGAAIGAAAGSPATGAAVGAGAGLFGGTAVGASNAYAASGTVQRRYDSAYVQCMYAKGNQVPVPRSAAPAYRSPAPPPAPPPPPPVGQLDVPPPPVGAPPPPPPGPYR
jgi:uncharacterized protein YcfJ